MTNSIDILTAFEIYKKIIFSIEVDLRFWESFLSTSINEYQKRDSKPDKVFSGIFTVYNIDPFTSKGLLKSHKEVYSIETAQMGKYSNDFFVWVANLSLLKAYNALETFLLQSIHLRYYSTHKSPVGNKKAFDLINKEIRTYLLTHNINCDTKNNRHIIEFLKHNSAEIKSFLQLPARVDLKTNWESFFELISILRNVIAHQGTIISNDTFNEIKSKAKDVFQRHFILPKDKNDYMNLCPIVEQFSNFLIFFNDFTLNCVKLMFNKNDLSIFRMT